jgi:hypothetical protein
MWATVCDIVGFAARAGICWAAKDISAALRTRTLAQWKAQAVGVRSRAAGSVRPPPRRPGRRILASVPHLWRPSACRRPHHHTDHCGARPRKERANGYFCQQATQGNRSSRKTTGQGGQAPGTAGEKDERPRGGSWGGSRSGGHHPWSSARRGVDLPRSRPELRPRSSVSVAVGPFADPDSGLRASVYDCRRYPWFNCRGDHDVRQGPNLIASPPPQFQWLRLRSRARMLDPALGEPPAPLLLAIPGERKNPTAGQQLMRARKRLRGYPPGSRREENDGAERRLLARQTPARAAAGA